MEGKEYILVYGIMNLLYILDPNEKMKITKICPLKGIDVVSLNTIRGFYQLTTEMDECIGLFVSDLTYFIYDFKLREVLSYKVFSSEEGQYNNIFNSDCHHLRLKFESK